MNIQSTSISGVYLIERERYSDNRGSFSRIFCENELSDLLGPRSIVQANHSVNKHVGTIRGLHLQHGIHAEIKFVTCLRGAVWDVAVDLRPDSPSYLQWYGAMLQADKNLTLVVPEGCAHGFQVVAQNSELVYLHTASYRPEAESGVRFDDPALNITWPQDVTEVSARDQNYPLIDTEFTGFRI